MKLKSALCLALLAISLFSQAQTKVDVVIENDDAKTAFIEENFNGGFNGYIKFFQEKLRYPSKSYEAQLEGLLLINYTINKAKGSAKVQFLTLLDKDIEKQVRSVIKASLPFWNIKDNKDHKFYQPIVYSLLPYYGDELKGDIPEIPLDLPTKFLEPLILIQSDRNTQKVAMASLSKVDVDDPKKTFYFGLQEAYDRFKKKGDKLSAYRVLTQIIKYNPLDKDYLIDRIKLEVARSTNRYQVYDSDLLTDFVDSQDNRYKGRITESNKNNVSASKAVEKNLISDNYEGGLEGFEFDFLRKVAYPVSSQALGTQGVSLLKFSIPPQGAAKATLLTKLDAEIDKSITDAAEFTYSWERRDSTYHEYMAFFFSKEGSFVKLLTDEAEAYQQLKESKKDLMIVEHIGNNDPQTSSIKNTTDGALAEAAYSEYLAAKASYEKLSVKGKAKKIFPVLTQLIRFNPFDKALIEERIKFARPAKKDEFLESDKALLAALDEILKK